MKELSIIEHREFGSVRTEIIKGEPWFVAKDICDILGYLNNRKAIADNVDAEDISDVTISDGSQNRKMTIINESGLYSLMLSSRLEKAKKFRRWVTSEVLPSIRKYGKYIQPHTPESVKALARYNLRKKMEMLREIKKHLTSTDVEAIRHKLRIHSDYRVNDVLKGDCDDPTILTECILRATKNSQAKRLLGTDGMRTHIVNMLRSGYILPFSEDQSTNRQ